MVTRSIRPAVASSHLALLAWALGAFAPCALAAQLRVGPGFPYATIQSAINAATAGDEVLVEPGAYVEAISLAGKAITVRSRTGAMNTYVLPPSAGQTIVSCIAGETASTVVDGFTILNASGACGIRVTGSSPTFRNCSIQNCQATNAPGGGLVVDGANPAPRFEGCDFSANRATNQSGAGAFLASGLTTFTHCYFLTNQCIGCSDLSGAAILAIGGRIAATNVVFNNNEVRLDYCNCANRYARGGSVYVDGAPSTFTDCSFSNSLARTSQFCGTGFSHGGSIFESGSASTYLRCTFTGSAANGAGNCDARGGAMYFTGGADPTIDGCTFTGPRANPDNGNGLGGCLFYEGGSQGTVRSTLITGAQAGSVGGAIYVAAGAAPIVTDTDMRDCSAGNEGGGAYFAPRATTDPPIVFIRTEFIACSARIGGGACIRDNTPLVLDSGRFTGCVATPSGGEGGGIYCHYAPISVRSTAFDLNVGPLGSAMRTVGDTNRFPTLRGNFFCGNSGSSTNWVVGTWFDAPPFNTNQFAEQCSADCNNNGIFDSSEIASGAVPDCNGNGVPDSCDIASGAAPDCNLNGRPDACDIASGKFPDCNGNGIPDSCDIASGTAPDCNLNGRPDACDIATGKFPDCDANGVPDSCQADCDADGIPNPCEIAAGAPDCNANGVPDACDLAAGTLTDRNQDGIPDSCQVLEYLGLRSEYVPVAGTANDPSMPSTAVCMRVYAEFSNAGADLLGVYGNNAHPMIVSVPAGGFFQSPYGGNTSAEINCVPEIDLPSIRYDSWLTINKACNSANALQAIGFNFEGFNTGNGFQDNDCIAFVTPGSQQAFAGPTRRVLIAQVTTRTGAFPTVRVNLVGRNSNGSDWLAFRQVAPQPALVDCNSNGVHDVIDVANGTSRDCNDNGLPDSCEFPNYGADCNANGIPDTCDILAGTSQDADNNGVPDECECIGDVNRDGFVDVDDVVAVILAWGDTGPSPADINRDGFVNGDDLGLVLGGYGGCI